MATDLGRAAKSKKLINALIDSNQGAARGMDILVNLLASHDSAPSGTHCRGMEG